MGEGEREKKIQGMREMGTKKERQGDRETGREIETKTRTQIQRESQRERQRDRERNRATGRHSRCFPGQEITRRVSRDRA